MREARVGRSQGVGASFSARAHVLGSLESIRNRFDDFYFSTKIMIFRKFLKIYDFCYIIMYPGQLGRVISSRCVDLGKSKNMMRGGVIGATESRNKLGMLVVMSLQLSVAIGGT